MIVDYLERWQVYRSLHPAFVEAFEYLQSQDFTRVDPGKYTFGEYGSYAGVNVYETKPAREAWPEAHRRYIDVQYLVSGLEWIGYSPLDGQEIFKPYDEQRDIIFFRDEPSLFLMEPGMFAIFYPGDLHMPGIDRDNPGGGLPSTEVKKVVVKIPVYAVEG